MSRRTSSIAHGLRTGLLTWAVLALAATPAFAQELRQRFDIPAQAAGDALNAFSRQSGLRLLFPFEAVSGKQTPALSGELTAEEALEKLLAGSDLTFEITSSSVVLIREKAATKTSGITAPQQSITLAQNDQRAAQVAQAEQPAATAPQITPRAERPKEGTNLVDIGEVVVTGSHIRGVVGAGSNLTVIDRNYIDASGYTTVQDIVNTLPQAFKGGVTESFTMDPSAGNANQGSAINLRGLGVRATLVLINGRRPVPGGFEGAFVDVSNIPSSAIERIEVLTDGTSAIYGADAVAGVVNVILRKDYDGAETRGRFGTLDGDADEVSASQLFGKNWGGGNALVGYQYYKRDALAFMDRSFSANSDQRPRGGDNFSSISSNPGNIVDFTGQPVFAIPPGQDGTSLTASDLLPGVVNFQNTAELRDLLPEQEMQSAFVSASQDIGERVHLFAEGRYNVRDMTFSGGGFGTTLFVPGSNPFSVDPFGFGFVLVGYNFLDDLGPSIASGESTSYGGTLGATLDLDAEWQLTVAGSYGEDKNRIETSSRINPAALGQALADPDPATAFNPFGDGSNTNPATLQAMRGTAAQRAGTDVWSADISADGPLFELAGGAARLAIGADHRQGGFRLDSITHEIGTPDSSRSRSRNVSALYAELALPLVGRENALPGVQGLDVSLAGRYDDYGDFGSTFNPKLGVGWVPVRSLTVRGTWGTSFNAPRLGELDETPATNSAFLFPIEDPQAQSGTSVALLLFGNNENLQEETATTWTAGMEFAPVAMPDMKLSLTYFDIEYEDQIIRPGPFLVQNILLEEDQWADVITRNPSQEEVDAICNSPAFVGQPGICALTPPTVIADFRLRNLAVNRVRGFDLSIDQTSDTTLGVLGYGVSGSYISSFEKAASETSPEIDVVDTLFNPAALRLRGNVSWGRKGWGVAATINYTDSYEDTQSQPNRSIDAWTTVDVQASYRTVIGEGWLDNLALTLSAVNVFDEDPPFANQAIGYDVSNADPYGRFISLQISIGW